MFVFDALFFFIMFSARITYNYGHQHNAFSQLKCQCWCLHVCCLILHNRHQAAKLFLPVWVTLTHFQYHSKVNKKQ